MMEQLLSMPVSMNFLRPSVVLISMPFAMLSQERKGEARIASLMASSRRSWVLSASAPLAALEVLPFMPFSRLASVPISRAISIAVGATPLAVDACAACCILGMRFDS